MILFNRLLLYLNKKYFLRLFVVNVELILELPNFVVNVAILLLKQHLKLKYKEVKKPSKETDIAEFTDGVGCNVKLTSEKIYAKSVGLEETYALRSVDGAGVYDDMELFAKEKLEAESKARTKKIGGYMAAPAAISSLIHSLYGSFFVFFFKDRGK